MKLSHKIAAGVVSLVVGGVSIPVVPVPLTCNVAIRYPLYDTASGKLDDGFYDAANGVPAASSTAPFKAAHKVGEYAETYCTDDKGGKYVVPITTKEYSDLGLWGAKMPIKSTSESLIQKVL